MSVIYPPELINEIKMNNPIIEVMKEYGKVISHDGKTVCDFHKDESPSMHVYDDGYYCYVCGAGKTKQELTLPDGTKIIDGGSDVIGYTMNKERINWHEAMQLLAARAGIALPEEVKDPYIEGLKQKVTDSNRNYYTHLQQDPKAMQYLTDRGLELSDITKWRIGMVPWTYADKRYAGRIVFGMTEVSYQPERSKSIAMAYRIRQVADYVENGIEDYAKHMNAKYINDPTSKIYEKKNYLYGLNEARNAIRKKGYAVIMEGYMDVIMGHKYGLDMSVAACGTSVTEEQIKLLKRYTSKVFLWLDGDAAGRNAMQRCLPILLKEGFDVLIVESPGFDPAELAITGEDMVAYVRNNSKPAAQLVIDSIVQKYDTIVNRARIDALEKLLPLVECIQRPADKANYKAVLENKLGVRL